MTFVCVRCHLIKDLSEFYFRADSGKYRPECKICTLEREHSYQILNAELIKKRRHRHYLRNRELLLSKQLVYASQRRQQEAERARRWRAEHPDKMRQLNVSYYARNRCQVLAQKSAYNKEHPEDVQARSRNRKARIRGASTGTVTAKQWSELKSYYEHRCAYCLKPTDALTMDHMIPIARGGEHDISNVVPACRDCNFHKHTMTLIEFLPRMQEENSVVFAR